MSLRLLDLFSGIGGFSLGLERAGFTTVAFCEQSASCRHLLAHHWPGVPCYDDVCTLDAGQLVRDVGPIDAICGGFPCQDISFAGAGAGIEGARSGLWREYARLIRELRPRLVFVENVAALRFRGLDTVLNDLAASGYNAWWGCVPAVSEGAPHKRDRLWVVGFSSASPPDAAMLFGEAIVRNEPNADLQRHWTRHWRKVAEDLRDVDDGVPGRLDGLHGLGNAVVPQIPEILGRAALRALNAA